MLIEKELKALISEEKYNEILTYFTWDKAITHTNNYYLDEKRILKKAGVSIRVREIGNEYLLQIKTTVLRNRGLHIKNEYQEKFNCLPNAIKSKKIYDITGIETGDAMDYSQKRGHDLVKRKVLEKPTESSVARLLGVWGAVSPKVLT
ncbi:MAG: CYTH domain-containing protein, partial [Defluviitaleaceae bacterium]|nr:CYTH domain-containing protein [Defluviitaleaceae bacterium]